MSVMPLARRERGLPLPAVISAGNGMPSTVSVSEPTECGTCNDVITRQAGNRSIMYTMHEMENGR
jgi:hypothetical protein